MGMGIFEPPPAASPMSSRSRSSTMDHLKTTIDSIRNLRKWVYFNEQFLPAVIEHERRNDSQFSNLLEQLWGTERVLCRLSSSTLEAPCPLLQELDCVLGRAITLVKEVCFQGSKDPASRRERETGEHYLEVFLDLRWWTWLLIYNPPLRTACDEESFFVTPKGVLDPSSSRLPSFMQKLYLWWSSSDGYARHLPSYGIEVFLRATEGLPSLLVWLKTENGEPLDKFDVTRDICSASAEIFVIEGKVLVPVLYARKPSWVGDELKVDLTQAVLGISGSGLVIKCEDSGTEYALKRVQNLDQRQPVIARLCHPHIVQLMSYWRENGFLFLMMEFMEGDLKDLIKRRLRVEKSPFIMNVVLDILLQIAKAMLYLHDTGLTHPHLKSSDVLFKEAADRSKLDKNDTKYLVKLGDFQFDSKSDFESMTQRNVYQYGLICLEVLSTEPLHWELEERVTGMSEERKLQFNKIQNRHGYAIPGSLTQCITRCLEGSIEFSEVVVMLLLAQLQVLMRATKETSPRSSDSEHTLLAKHDVCVDKDSVFARQGTSGKTSSPGIASSAHGKQLCDAVYAFHEPQEQVDVEIVFIHGLEFYGSKEAYWKTWLAGDGTQDNCWPQTLLVEKFPYARILSLSYDANVVQTSTLGRMDLYSLGESLVQEMTLVGIGQHECPVMFVCHGFGGLVAKQIVVTASQNFQRDKEVQNFLHNLRAFYFYGTPHAGVQVDLAPWSSLPTHGSRMSYQEEFRLEVGRLNFEFERIQRKVYNNEWMCFNVGAMHATSHGRKVVPESSTRHGGDGFLPLSANHFDICRPQSEVDSGYLFLIDCISKVIKYNENKQHRLLDLPNGLVGMDDMKNTICEKLGRVSIFGLVGMGGIGKTTISKFVYNSQAKFYDKTCFLQDVRSKDVASVQKELLLELCGVTVDSSDNVSLKHLRSIEQCIMGRRVLIVIDDVGDSKTLKGLQVPAFQKSLSNGSRVIVTCRNRQVLENHVSMEGLKDVEIMEMEFLNGSQALELFRSHVFSGVEDKEEMESFQFLAMAIADACCGLPLSLEVIGQHLRRQHVHSIGTQKEIWKEALRKLGEAQSFYGVDENEVLWKSLKISYDDLSNDTKSMFLDFACIFCEKSSLDLSEQSIGWIWNSPTGLQDLIARSLIKVSGIGAWGCSFTIHDQLRDMGRRIVKDASLKRLHMSLKNMTRLWEAEEIKSFLEVHQGSRIIEGISLRECRRLAALQSQANPKLLSEMTIQRFDRLRLLDLTECGIEVVEFCLRKCWKELSWLCLDEVYGKVMPHAIEAIGFCTGLRVLQMRGCSNMEELPASIGNLVHLLEFDLSECDSLRSLPREIGHLKRLKRFQLWGCKELKEVPLGVSQLIDLEYLGLGWCSKLVSMAEFETQMDHLYELDLSGCRYLQIPFKSLGKLHQLRALDMEGCVRLVIENPSESFGQLSRLEKLNLAGCNSLIFGFCLGSFARELAGEEVERLWDLVIGSFSFCLQELRLPAIFLAGLSAYPRLKVLEVHNTFHLEELPTSLGDLTQLERLTVYDVDPGFLRTLPDSLSSLVKLEVLKLIHVGALDMLPEKLGHLSSLKTLEIVGMRKLEELPMSLGQLSQLEHFALEDCESLKRLPDFFASLTRLSELTLRDCCELVELPASLGQLSQLEHLDLMHCTNLKRDSSTSLTQLSALVLY